MTAPIRILDTGLAAASWNVAMTAALGELHAKGAVPDTVRLHRYPACVLLGRNQAAAAACDLDYCHRAGIAIARRVTGGGAVYMSPRMLAWDVAIDRAELGGDLAIITRRICEAVAAGLSRLGVIARYRAPNDIEIGGRKVSGSSGFAVGRSAILQGTVLIEDDTPAMARALRIPDAALRSNVTCLANELAEAPSLSAVAECLTEALSVALGREAAAQQPTAEELALCGALLQDEIGTEEFISGRAMAPVDGALE